MAKSIGELVLTVQIEDEKFEELIKYIEKLVNEIMILREENEFIAEEIKRIQKKVWG